MGGTASATSATAAPLLQARGLHAAYGSAAVLHGVDLELRSGEVVGLLGRNGMGKTTLVRTLMGALPPRAGTLQVGGQVVTNKPAHVMARLGLAVVPEGRQVFSNLSVEEHLSAFVRPGVGAAAPVWQPAQVFDLFPRLAERRQNMGNQLSGGEQQMLAIGRALVTNPRLLILDEATEGLAPLIREEIWRALALLRQQGQTILVIDKYVQRLITLADRHVILEKGLVAWAGSSAELQADPGLWHRYLGV